MTYPRLVAAEYRHDCNSGVLASSVPELDLLLGGGLDRGTSTLLMGAAGSGKSVLASLFATAAGKRGEKAAIYAFDEALRTVLARAEGLGLPMQHLIEAGQITVQPIDPAEMSPGAFAHAVRQAVERNRVSIVVIDSLNGYLNAMPEEKFLIIQLHELLSFLSHCGVVTILVMSQSGLLGTDVAGPIDISYLADTVVLLRYFESAGTVRKAVSVLKRRSGNHERSIRELILAPGGVRVGPPLSQFEGVLSGTATYNPAFSQDHAHA